MLPEDVRSVVPDDASPDADGLVDAISEDLAGAAPRRMAGIIRQHQDAIATLGRARRIRLLAWIANRSWPDAQSVVGQITDEGGDASGESGGEGKSGPSKVASLFRADIKAYARICTARMVRSASDLKAIDAVRNGIKEYEVNMDMRRTGGMV